MPKNCCVLGCTSEATRTFKLPEASENRKRFLTWLAASGNSTLLNVPPHSLRNRTICICHFEEKYVLSKKLSTSAVPTLHLPGKIDVSAYEMNNFKEKDSPNISSDHNKNENIEDIIMNTPENTTQSQEVQNSD